jgi:4-amino-4-deoxy-L-arabinose transferase-like glycosyltransferase/SAM-dependent methyltransferase
VTYQQHNGTNDDLLWRQLKTIPAFRALLRSVEARFYQRLTLPGPTLDVGCGDGHFTQMTFDEPLAVGLDPWWGPLQKAQASGMYQAVLQGTGDCQPFPDHYFGSAISNSVLEHIPEVQAVLNETNRVLQLGAPFVITMPSHYFTEYLRGAAFLESLRLPGLAGKYREFFNFISRHAHTDPPEIWGQRLARAGFAVERWQYYFSRQALHALEWGHVQGLPSAVLHFLTGHWIIAPWENNLQRTEQWVRPFFEEEFGVEGAYMLFIARKVAGGPVRALLPAAHPFTIEELVDSEEGEASGEWRVAREEWRVASDEEQGVWDAEQVASGEEAVLVAAEAADLAGLADEPAELAPEKPKAARPSLSLPRLEAITPRRALYLVALILAIFAQSLGSSQNGGFAILAWLAAAAIAFYALSNQIPANLPNSQSSNLSISQSFNLSTLLIPTLLFIAALLVRAVNLTEHPFILNGTEASIGLDIMHLIDGSLTNPFATGWLSNPTLPYSLLAIPVKLWGPSTVALRALSPLVGAATVLLVYWLGTKLWGRGVGLVAAVLLLGSHFHIHFSRLGVTNIWDPFMVLLALGLLALAWQQGNNRPLWLLAGTAIGLNAYFFTSSHLLPLILLALLLLTTLFEWRKVITNWHHIAAAAALALVVALPLILYYNSHPGLYMERANSLGILDSHSGWLSREVGFTGQSRSQIWWQQIRRGMLAFNTGMDNSPAYRPEAPLLNLGPSLLFLIGMAIALWHSRQLRYSLLTVWVLVTLVFGAVLLENPPNSHRLIIAAPALSLLAAVALISLGHFVIGQKEEGRGEAEVTPRTPRPAPLTFLGILLAIAILLAGLDIAFYFGRYQSQHTFGDRNTEIADNMAHYLNTLEGDWAAYFYGPPNMYVGFPTIPLLVQDFHEGINLFDVPPDAPTLPLSPAPNQVFIFLPERFGEAAAVQSQLPGGELHTFSGFHADPLFHVYEVQNE